jgi:hypothetical protein
MIAPIYSLSAGIGFSRLSPSEARAHVCFTASLEAAIPLIRHRAKPKPALRFDTGRWVGQWAVLVHERPEVVSDVGLGGVVPHSKYHWAPRRSWWHSTSSERLGLTWCLFSKNRLRMPEARPWLE